MKNKPFLIQKNPFPYKKDSFETVAWKRNRYICGLDEAGRGALAGPIVAAAVVLMPHALHPDLKDSKRLSPAKREKMYRWISLHGWWTAAPVCSKIIDQTNIVYATQLAMHRALTNMLFVHQHIYYALHAIVIDAVACAHLSQFQPFNTICAIKGEYWSSSIAAASIIAKVYRDRLMTQSNDVFKGYAFDKHKGYGTAQHQTLIKKRGRSLFHRTSFLKKIIRAQ